jgi:hypothetical protein
MLSNNAANFDSWVIVVLLYIITMRRTVLAA